MTDLIKSLTIKNLSKKHSNFKVQFQQTIQSFQFLQSLKKDFKLIRGQSCLKNFKPNKKILIFDLDETLIHCNIKEGSSYDVQIPVKFPSGEMIDAGINVRPYAKQILVDLAPYFEIVIFTASHSCYANPVIDYLDDQKVIKARLFR